LTTTVEKDYGPFSCPLLFDTCLRGRGTPAQGRGGRRYSVPLGRGRGRQMEGGATLADCGHQVKGTPAHLSPKICGGVKNAMGNQVTSEALTIFFWGGIT
jgi:hypothetical protein